MLLFFRFKNRYRPPLFIFLLTFSLISLCDANAEKTKIPDRIKLKKKDKYEFRGFVYDQAFKERFDLPAKGVEKLSPGLRAAAIVIKKEDIGRHFCSIYLYLDNKLNIAFPKGGSGENLSLKSYSGELFFVSKFKGEDIKYDTSLFIEYINKILVRTKQKKDNEHIEGFYESVIIDKFSKELLPSISFVSFTCLCSFLDPQKGPAEIFIKKEGSDFQATAYTRSKFKINRDQVYQFDFPVRLHKFSWPALKAVIEFNDKVRIDRKSIYTYDVPE